jgi:hypothetical protein
MNRDPSPEREIFRITDDELTMDEFDVEDDFTPLRRKKPSRMASFCKRLTYMVRGPPRAKYTDGL